MEKIIVIFGPTASFKTNLSIKIAQTIPSEIISADSRQIYEGLDVGTAKITHEEMEGIPHHMIDIRKTEEHFDAKEYQEEALAHITSIHSQEKIPIIVGGTGFYINTIIYNNILAHVPKNDALRKKLSLKDTSELVDMIQSVDITSSTKHNKQRLMRYIEIEKALGSLPPQDKTHRFDTLFLYTHKDQETLKKNITIRVEKKWTALLQEINSLLSQGVSYEWLCSLGLEYTYGLEALTTKNNNDAKEKLITKTLQYAKRQKVWAKQYTNVVLHTNTPHTLAVVKEFIR